MRQNATKTRFKTVLLADKWPPKKAEQIIARALEGDGLAIQVLIDAAKHHRQRVATGYPKELWS